MEEIIKVVNLSKTFKNGNNEIAVLSDINLTIKKGCIFGIIGLSGAGKSTLVRMFNKLILPTDGEVYFENQLLNTVSKKDLIKIRRNIGMIFQDFNLLEQKNVLKNVLFPFEISGIDKSKSLKRSKELLDLVGLGDKIHSFPSQLSGGQKQRVAIARALALNPKVILCDEATSALDPKTTSQILDLLKKINKELNVTIVIITHQMNVIEKICDEVAILGDGRIVESGNVRDIFNEPKSEIGKKLIFGDDKTEDSILSNLRDKTNLMRFIFDGVKINEPISSEIAMLTGEKLNILFANTKIINGNITGQMIVQLPNNNLKKNEIKEYLQSKNVKYMEV